VKNETATPVSDDTTTTTEPTMPKMPKTATITLTAPGGTMQIVAERRADNSARTYIITTDTEKKSARGMSQNHPSFDAAKAASEKMAVKTPPAAPSTPVAPKGKK